MIVYMRDASWQRSPNNSSSGKGGTRYHRPRADDAALAHCDPMIMLNDDQPCRTDDELLFGMLCRKCFPVEPVGDRAARSAVAQPNVRRTHHERCAQPEHYSHVWCQLLPVAT